MKARTKNNKRNTAIFYALLKLQPDYISDFSGLIKECVVEDFTRRKCKQIGSSLSALSDSEYRELIKEMEANAVKSFEPKKAIDESLRRDYMHKILLKLSALGINNAEGYDDINKVIRSLKGFGSRILPEFSTDELPDVFKAVCSYVDYYQARKDHCKTIALLN